jgi:hypothetical protein
MRQFRNILFLFLSLLALKSEGQYYRNPAVLFAKSNASPVTFTTFSSVHSSVDGRFVMTATADREITGFTTGDVTVTNGTCEYIYSADNIAHYLWIIPNGAGDVGVSIGAGVCTAVNNGGANAATSTVTTTIDTGWKFLSTSSSTHMRYDLREICANNSNDIESTDPGKNDLSGNGRTLTGINTPKGRKTSTDPHVGAFRMESTRALSTGVTLSGIVTSSFVAEFAITFNDGRSTTTQWICGNQDGTNTGFIVEVNTSGILIIRYHTLVWTSSAAVFANGTTATQRIKIVMDFSGDAITVTQNETSVAGSITSGSITNVEAGYACTANFYIGNSNNNGTAQTQPDAASLFYFYISGAQGASASAASSYLQNKKHSIEFVYQEQDNTNYDAPHDIDKLTRIDPLSDISCKGDGSLTTQDGCWLKINDQANLADITISASRVHQTDQIDGETVVVLSSTRTIHFVASSALLINRSDGSVVTSVSYTSSVINGAEKVGNYIFGSAKDGFIHVFTSNDGFVSNISLVGSKNTGGADGLGAAHDMSFIDSQYLMICSNVSALSNRYIGTYRAFDGSGNLITPSTWTLASFIANDALAGANRNRKVSASVHAVTMNNPGFGVAKINTTDPTNISFTNAIGLIDACAGLDVYRGKYAIVGNTSRIRIVDMTSSTNAALAAGYANNITFATTDSNIHDLVWSLNLNDMKVYLTPTFQGDNRLGLFRVNRF